MKQLAVLTGDLVNSAQIGNELLNLLRDELKARFVRGQHVLLGMEFFQGDTFQMVCAPHVALQQSLLIRSLLRYKSKTATDARIAVGIGTADVLKESTGESDGEAFTLSGHQLRKLGKQRIISFSMDDADLQDELNTYAALAETIVSDWTTLQASCVYLALEGKNQQQTAEQLSISQPAVSKALQAGNYQALQIWLQRYQKRII